MKFLLIAVFAILGYVGANCGCLKCSKHLTVLGEIPGAPGQVPIKVICRCEQGYPNVCDFVPVQPIAVQVPVPKPEPVPVCGSKYPIKLKPFFKPYCADGCYLGSGSITGPGAAGNPCASSGNVYDYSDYYGPIVPVKVQVPVPQPEENKCFTLQGLQTAVDRIILPAPAICATGITPYDRYVADKYHYGCGGCHHHHHHHCSSGCNSCHHRYDSQNLNSETSKFPNLANQHSHSRSKRQILQHGYKFIVNMLPPFIQEPIKDTVNKMAITHPDKKLRKVYNLPPPPLTLKEKIELKHKENVAALKNKLFGTPIKKTNTKPLQKTYKTSKVYDYETTKKKGYEPSKKHYKYQKSYVDDNVVEEEVGSFADSLRNPEQKKKKGFLRSRTALPQSDKKTDGNYSWLKEMKAADVLGKHFSKKHRTDRMTAKEKALFLEKLQKLNQNSNKAKTTGDPLKTSKSRSKRSIIIGSDELNLPLYQIKIRESEEEENEIDHDYEYDDYDYDYDDDDRVGMRPFDASKEELIRNAIREELKKFRQVQSEEELVGDPVSFFQDDKIGSKFPLLRILTFPMKLLKKVRNNEELPIVGAFPKMIVGTKKYFKDFGKNFKKNFLHFTSDIIGDFDHYGPSDNILANFIKPNRFRRSIDGSSNFIEDSETQNFRNVSNVKVRKKRYILKMVDDDEIEELLRQKLGKMFDEPHKSHKPRRKHRNKPKKYYDSMEHEEHYKKRTKKHLDEFVGVQRKKRRPENKHMKKVKENSMEQLKKKIIVEQIKPKVIIDNNGLPFMEVNGYKRPLFMKNLIKDKEKKEDNSIENSSFDNYDSSEESNLQKIHHVIDNAKQKQGVYSRNTEVPLETLKDKISELLHDIDTLVHMDFDKYDDVYDDLIEIQSVKTSIVQSWKRIIMDKKINDHNAKIGLLEKFTHLQHLKTKTMKSIVYVMSEDCENSFALEKVIHVLMALHKIQCVIDQVVGCFQEKFKTGSKFEMTKEIKFVDFLASLKFVRAKTRNDMVCRLKEDRDKELQECIILLEKLKKLLVEGDEASIEEEANILWEMKHVQKMQINTIEEMCDRLEEGLRIKKNMKVLFDLSRRLKVLQEREKKICLGKLTKPSCEEEEDDEDDESKKDKKKVKKFDIEEFKKKWQDKVQKQKEQIEESFKKRMLKLKELKKKNKIVEEDDETDENDETEEDENVSEEDENENE